MYAADNPAPDLVYAALVCSTVARGAVERIDPAAAVRDPRCVACAHRLRRGQAAVRHPTGVLLRPARRDSGGDDARGGHARRVLGGGEVPPWPAADEYRCATSRAEAGHAGPATTPAATPTPRCGLPRWSPICSYSIMRNNHNPMEIPATVASWDGDRLTVWDKVQSISWGAEDLCRRLRRPGDHVRVISPFVGGAFGSAGTTWPHQLLAAFAARQIRRPVKLMLTRKQYYSGIGYRPDQPAAHGDRRGPLRPHQCHRARGAHRDLSVQRLRGQRDDRGPVSSTPRRTCGPRIALCRLISTRGCPMRGPGATTGTFALESAMDDLAFRLGMDPIELRTAQRTRSRRLGESAVLDPSAHRLPPAGRRRVRLVATKPHTARHARWRPADRHRHGGGGVSHGPQPVCGAGTDQRRRHRRRSSAARVTWVLARTRR